jgi:hypothetical protein
MARLITAGFDTHDLRECPLGLGGTVATDRAKTGPCALRLYQGEQRAWEPSWDPELMQGAGGYTGNFYLAAHVYVESIDGTEIELAGGRSTAGNTFRVVLRAADGNLLIRNGMGDIVAIGTIPVQVGQWFHLQVFMFSFVYSLVQRSSICTVKVNQVEACHYQIDEAADTLNRGWIGMSSSFSAGVIVIDNLIVNDISGQQAIFSTWPGECVLNPHYLGGAAPYNDWEPSTPAAPLHEMIDDSKYGAPDGDDTYIRTATSADGYFFFSPLGQLAADQSIISVWVRVLRRRTGTGLTAELALSLSNYFEGQEAVPPVSEVIEDTEYADQVAGWPYLNPEALTPWDRATFNYCNLRLHATIG